MFSFQPRHLCPNCIKGNLYLDKYHQYYVCTNCSIIIYYKMGVYGFYKPKDNYTSIIELRENNYFIRILEFDGEVRFILNDSDVITLNEFVEIDFKNKVHIIKKVKKYIDNLEFL